MLEFINKEHYSEISGYDIEIINLSLKGEVNERRIRFIKDHLDFKLEREYLDFLKNNISVVFKINEKIINLHYAYEAVKQNIAKEIYEIYNLKATIIGQVVVNDIEKDIFLMEKEGRYGVYILEECKIKKIGDSFKSVFTDGIGRKNF